MTSIKRAVAIAFILPVLCLSITGASVAAGAANQTVATQAPAVEICFPFASWGPASIDRVPCDTIGRPNEDGSGYLYLGTLSNDKATCVIPNPAEERGRFVIHCKRVPQYTGH